MTSRSFTTMKRIADGSATDVDGSISRRPVHERDAVAGLHDGRVADGWSTPQRAFTQSSYHSGWVARQSPSLLMSCAIVLAVDEGMPPASTRIATNG